MKALQYCRRFLAVVGTGEKVIAGGLLALIVLLIFVQVLLRAGLGTPLAWMEEGVTYCFVWLTFLGASIGLKYGRHIKLTAAPSMLSHRGKELAAKICRLVVLGIIGGFLIILIRLLFDVAKIEGSATTVALPIDLPRSLFFSVALLINSISMLVTVCYYICCSILGLRTETDSEIMRILPAGQRE